MVLLVLMVASCSPTGTDSGSAHSVTATTAATRATDARPVGPAAKVAQITGGTGVLLPSPRPGPDLAKAGYVQSEYQASGTATAYAQKDGATKFPFDGKIDLEPTTEASYATRFVVRRPADPASFNGTVVVEWDNVSGGLDVAPDWTYTAEELVRSGYAWVGVTTQRIGIEGGPVAVATPASRMGGAGEGIRAQDPDRYGALHHPGDAYSYDIYTQVARALRANDGAVRPLGDLKPKRLLAMGESQSAFALTTYYDGVQPLTEAFDGFLIHSRGGSALPLGSPGKGTDIAAAVTAGDPVRFRTDLRAPVVDVQTETDVVGILKYLPARQPDNAHLRVWEVAGTAHVDIYQLTAPVAELFDCPEPVNAGPDHFVVASALAALNNWVVEGRPAPRGQPLKVNAHGDGYVLDAHGNAEGGVRTPEVDVPVDVLSGLASTSPTSSTACLLAGSTIPIPPDELASMYPSRSEYLRRYAAATDAAIRAGFVLRADRREMLADAEPARIAP